LKQNLIKQKEEQYEKKIGDHKQKIMKEEQKKKKENMKVMANIAYKEWKERKREEGRQKKKIEKLERRRALIEVEEQHLQRRHNVA